MKKRRKKTKGLVFLTSQCYNKGCFWNKKHSLKIIFREGNHKMCKALDVAKWIVKLSAEAGDFVTNLKLQKLLYYAQAWHLVLYDKKLFPENIQAWIHGPVVPSVYREFKECGIQPIDPAKFTEMIPLQKPTKDHLLNILQVFSGYSAYQLELMTHSEDPWKNARKGLDPDQSSRKVISIDDMKNFYTKMLQEHEKQEKK